MIAFADNQAVVVGQFLHAARHAAPLESLADAVALPALRASLRELAERNAELVVQGRQLSPQVRDWRLRFETAIIGQLAVKLNGWLLLRDPLRETVHLSKTGALWQALLGAGTSLLTPRLVDRDPHPRANRV